MRLLRWQIAPRRPRRRRCERRSSARRRAFAVAPLRARAAAALPRRRPSPRARDSRRDRRGRSHRAGRDVRPRVERLRFREALALMGEPGFGAPVGVPVARRAFGPLQSRQEAEILFQPAVQQTPLPQQRLVRRLDRRFVCLFPQSAGPASSACRRKGAAPRPEGRSAVRPHSECRRGAQCCAGASCCRGRRRRARGSDRV